MTATAPSHWEAGVIWEPLCAAAGATYDECLVVTGAGVVAEPAVKTATEVSNRRAATPFTVYARKDCSAPGTWEDMPADIIESLTEGEGWQVERTFWTGLAGGNKVVSPHLAANASLIDNNDTLQLAATQVVTGTGVDLVEGLGKLEQALANCYQGQGVIHVPVGLAAEMATQLQLIKVGSRYQTPAGNLVALGRGYTGSAPDGTSTANTYWIYATGAVFYMRGALRQVTNTQAFRENVNTLQQLAERTYIVGWDCCLLAVPITLTGEPSGT